MYFEKNEIKYFQPIHYYSIDSFVDIIFNVDEWSMITMKILWAMKWWIPNSNFRLHISEWIFPKSQDPEINKLMNMNFFICKITTDKNNAKNRYFPLLSIAIHSPSHHLCWKIGRKKRISLCALELACIRDLEQKIPLFSSYSIYQMTMKSQRAQKKKKIWNQNVP